MQGRNEEITAYLNKLYADIQKLSIYPHFSIEYKSILEKISLMIADHATSNTLIFTLTHLDAILHSLKIKLEASVFLPLNLMSSLQTLINEGYEIFEKHKQEFHSSTNDNPTTRFSPAYYLTPEDELRKELALNSEQKRFYNPHLQNLPFKKFLGSVWNYAVENNLPSKKVFISYAWPIDNLHMEKWTKNFTQYFAKHLSEAGIQVYLDEIHSGPGMWLRKFMGKISEMDGVIIINTRTMGFKLGLESSGVKYEADIISEALKQKKIKSVINILVNNGIYCHEAFRAFPWISFFQHGYLEGLKQTIGTLYKVDQSNFSLFWENQLSLHKITRTVWNVRPLIPYFCPRLMLLDELKGLVSQHKKVVCYGEAGSGKSELVCHYLHEYSASYKKVYWFTASSENHLIKNYIELASIENINITVIDSNPLLYAIKIKEWIEQQESCLLVFDNVDLSYESIQLLIPENQVDIILTSRNKLTINGYVHLEVGAYEPDEAEYFIKRIIGEKKYDAEINDIHQFIATIGRLPITLARACGYMQRNRKTTAQFLQLYKVVGEPLLLQNLWPLKAQTPAITTGDEEASQHGLFREHDFRVSSDIEAFLRELYANLSDLLCNDLIKSSDEIRQILIELLQIIQTTAAKDFWMSYFGCLVSHLEAAFSHFQDPLDIFEFIERGKAIIRNHYPLMSPPAPTHQQQTGVSVIAPSCIVVNQEDRPDDELKRFHEQQELDEITRQSDDHAHLLKLFLYDIWKYGLGCNNDRAYASKKVYIVLTDQEALRKEEWVYAYVDTLKKHLKYAGFIVYPNDLSAPTTQLGKMPEIDHVLLISHRNQGTDLDNEILNHPRFKANMRCFVIPVLLNNVNYLSKTFKEIAELSFYKNHYLNALRTIIRTLYNFDHDQFDFYWRKRLIHRKIINNVWNLPLRTKHFVGRETLLKTLKNRIATQDDKTGPVALTAACVGMGGVGKTQLALQFIHLYGHEYTRIYWINAESRESIIMSYVKLGHDKGLFNVLDQRATTDKVLAVKDWLANKTPHGWLIIYDNADKYDSKVLEEFIPHQGGKILITSRHTQWENCIPVNVFSPEEAKTYVREITGISDESEDENINELISTAGYHPLALAQACFYIKKNTVKIAAYLKLYQENKKDLLAQSALPENEHEPVYVTWNITFQKMEYESPLALQLLQYCSHLYNNNIPAALITDLLPHEPAMTLDDATRVASEYSMIHIDDQSGSLSLHCVLQQVIREQQNTKDRDKMLADLISYFYKNFKFSRYPEVKDAARYHLLCSHIESLCQFCQPSIKLMSILHEIGQYYLYQVGDYQYAEKYLLKASEMTVKSSTEEELKAFKGELAYILNSLGRLYLDLFELNKDVLLLGKANEYYTRSYEIKKSIYDPQSEDFYWAYGTKHSLGRVNLEYALYYKEKDASSAQQYLSIAEKQFSKVIEFRKRKSFEKDKKKQVHLGQSYAEYAYLLIMANRLDESEQMFELSLSILEKHLGKDYIDVAWVKHRRAHLLLKQGKIEESFNDFFDSITFYCKFYADRHQKESFHPRVKVVLSDIEKSLTTVSHITSTIVDRFERLRTEFKFDETRYPEIMKIQTALYTASSSIKYRRA